MQERFENYINKFQARKERIKNSKVPTNLFFGRQKAAKKIELLNQFLEDLKQYAEKTSTLIKDKPENKEFYKVHFEAVISMLENLDRKIIKPCDFKDDDFSFWVPHSVFNKIELETNLSTSAFALYGACFGAIAAELVAMGILVSLATTIIGFGTFIGIAFAGAAVGLAIGAFFGFLIGCFTSSYFYATPELYRSLAPAYIVLKDVYEVLSSEADNTFNCDSANEQDIGVNKSITTITNMS